MSDCEFCPDGHRDPDRQHWAVWVGAERDHDGQPINLHVGKTGCQHVAESDAEWLRQIISDARYRPTAELLAERNEAERKIERVRWLHDRLAKSPNERAHFFAGLLRRALEGA